MGRMVGRHDTRRCVADSVSRLSSSTPPFRRFAYSLCGCTKPSRRASSLRIDPSGVPGRYAHNRRTRDKCLTGVAAVYRSALGPPMRRQRSPICILRQIPCTLAGDGTLHRTSPDDGSEDSNADHGRGWQGIGSQAPSEPCVTESPSCGSLRVASVPLTKEGRKNGSCPGSRSWDVRSHRWNHHLAHTQTRGDALAISGCVRAEDGVNNLGPDGSVAAPAGGNAAYTSPSRVEHIRGAAP